MQNQMSTRRDHTEPWLIASLQFSSVTQSCPALQSHELQHARLPCPPPTPRAYSNSCPLSRNAIQLSHPCPPLLLLPSVCPSIRVFSNEPVLRIRWPKYWSFSFSISPSKDYSGLISFRMDWLDLLAVQGTLKSLLQHHSSKASSTDVTFWYFGISSTYGIFWQICHVYLKRLYILKLLCKLFHICQSCQVFNHVVQI